MDIKEFESKLKIISDHARGEFAGIRANRPSPKLIEDTPVEYLGERLSVKQLGSISVTAPRELQVSPWDHGALPAIAKGIEYGNLGLSVTSSGGVIRITLPMLSAERRVELVKITSRVSEEAKIKIRDARDRINKQIDTEVKAKLLTKDDQFSLKKKVQESVDRTNKDIEVQLAAKTKEIQE